MDIATFFSLLLPETGSFCLFNTRGNRSVWCAGRAEFIATAQKIVAQAPDWYYATAAFRTNRRKAANVAAKRCLYLDIDAGAEKFARNPYHAYPTLEAAQAAIVDFVKAVSAPIPSVIVRSGAGLHVYWAFDHDLPPDVWRGYAQRLRGLAEASSLKADHVCTCDAARLLRPVGALHSNGNTVTAVSTRAYTLEELALFTPNTGAFETSATRGRETLRVVNTDIAATGETPPLSRVVAALNALSPDCDYDTWIKVGMAVHSAYPNEDGFVAWDTWSANGKTYKADEMRVKWASFDENRPAGISVGTLFKRAADAGWMEPIGLPVEHSTDTSVEIAPADFPDLTGTGFRVEWTPSPPRLYATVKGEQIEVLYGFIFYFVDWCSTDGVQPSTYFMRFRNARDDWRCVPFSSGWVARTDSFNEALCKCSIHANPNTLNLLTRYGMLLLRGLCQGPERVAARKQFGFQFQPSGEFTFVHGQYAVRLDGKLHRAIYTEKLRSLGDAMSVPAIQDVAPVNNIYPDEVWDRLICAVKGLSNGIRLTYPCDTPTFNRAPYLLTLACMFASPLMLFVADAPLDLRVGTVPRTGVRVHLVSSESGVGKTHVLRIGGMAMGGDYLQESPASTVLGFLAKLGRLQCAPVWIDEWQVLWDANRGKSSGLESTRAMADITYTINSGRAKTALNNDGSMREQNADWAAVVCSSANVSHRDKLFQLNTSTAAQQMRLLEISMGGNTCDLSRRAELMSIMADAICPAQGAVPLLLARYVLTHAEECQKKITAFESSAFAALKLAPGERFFAKLAGAIYATAAILKSFGIHDLIDLPLVLGALRTAVEDMRERLSEESGGADDYVSGAELNALRTCIRELAPGILSTKTFDGPGQAFWDGSVPQVITGRYVADAHCLYLAKAEIKKWCCKPENGEFSPLSLYRAAVRAGLTVHNPHPKDHITLNKGFPGPSLQVACYAFDMAKLMPTYGTGGGVVIPLFKKPDDGPDIRPEDGADN